MYPQLSLRRQAGTVRFEELSDLMQMAKPEYMMVALVLASRDPAKFLKG